MSVSLEELYGAATLRKLFYQMFKVRFSGIHDCYKLSALPQIFKGPLLKSFSIGPAAYSCRIIIRILEMNRRKMYNRGSRRVKFTGCFHL